MVQRTRSFCGTRIDYKAAKGRSIRVAVDSTGKIVASGGRDGLVRLWDWRKKKQIGSSLSLPRIGQLLCSIDCLTFSLDGKYLAVGSEDKLIGVFPEYPIQAGLRQKLSEAVTDGFLG